MGTKLAVEVSGIQWDTDGASPDGIPSTMSFELDMAEDDPSEDEINEAATEHMSEETGFLVEGFSLDSVRKVDAPSVPGI